MGRSHGTALVVREQDRQAVGHHDGASQLCVRGHRSISSLAIQGLGGELKHINAMHLVQKNRPSRAQLRLQMLTVVGNRHGVVAHVISKIPTVKRRLRHAALPRGAQGIDP
jgi:hypothetical protein